MTLGSHQTTVGKSQVHLTPRWLLDKLGPFDLDPCAADPRPWDCAATNYTEAQDGLQQVWRGRVWLNPPFNRFEIDDWITRMAGHRNGIALLHARTETQWFQGVWRSAVGMLFLAQRITFCKPDGSPQTISKHYGKAANSGAPVVLAAFSEFDAEVLKRSSLGGWFVSRWAPCSTLEEMLG